ncbi:MAG TPA: hypothetical protein ACQGQW_01835 [Xylella fastidiosa subsp. pauca]
MDPLRDPRNAAQITPTHRRTDAPTHRRTDAPTHRRTDAPTTGNIAPSDALERHPHCNRRVSPNQTHLGNNHTETPVLKHSK